MIRYLAKNKKPKIIIIIKMEESIKEFSEFLTKICQTATKIEQYKIKISSVQNSHLLLFHAIDQQNHGEITCSDILKFCQQHCGEFQEIVSQKMGEYFGIYGQSIGFEEFSEWLTPKNTSDQFQDNQCTEPIALFIQLVSFINNQFGMLELFQQQFPQHWQNLAEYFYRKYGIKDVLTHENLRQFMIDRHIYNRWKYYQVMEYIFGKIDKEILWSQLFNQKKIYRFRNSQEFFGYQLKQNDYQDKPLYANQQQDDCQFQPNKQCQTKIQGNSRNKQSLEVQEQESSPTQQEQTNMKKMIPRTSKQPLPSKLSKSTSTTPKQKHHQQSQIKEKQRYKYCQHPNNQDYPLNKQRNTISGLVLKKSLLETQLKMTSIQQREKKSLDKYVKELKQVMESPNKKQNIYQTGNVEIGMSPKKNIYHQNYTRRNGGSQFSNSTNYSYFVSPLAKQRSQ